MFDWLRKATQSAEISRQERVLDYVEGTLSAEALKRFEAELSNDADLQREVAELRTVKAALNALPRQPVPRNFTLDPAKYSKPARAWDAQLYPAMRMATALSAIMFLIVATLTFLPFGSGGDFAAAPAAIESAQVADESAAEVAMVEEVSPEMAEAMDMAEPLVVQGEADSAEFDSAANSARVSGDAMDAMADDSAEMTEMVEAESADAAMPQPTLAPDLMSADDASADMLEEEVASDAAAGSGPAPASADSTAAEEAPLAPLPTRTAMPAPTLTPTEVFKAAPPIEEEAAEETVAEAISAEPAPELENVVVEESAPVDSVANAEDAAAFEMTEQEQSNSMRPIVLWAIALLALFLLLLFITLRTRARL